MLEMLTKGEVYEWFDRYGATQFKYELKGAQDMYIVGRLGEVSGKRILEIGGGNSRVINRLAANNECWNAEPYEGVGAGPQKPQKIENVTHAPVYLGQFSPNLQDNYFDYVFSISVVEHVPDNQLEAFFQDCARVLKPGGMMLHAIDVYLFDDAESSPTDAWLRRITKYRSAGENKSINLEFVAPPEIDSTLGFKCSFASNSDYTMYEWNTIAPKLKTHRLIAQCCCVKMEMRKPAD